MAMTLFLILAFIFLNYNVTQIWFCVLTNRWTFYLFPYAYGFSGDGRS